AARTGDPQLALPEARTQTSSAGASGARLPKRTHALSCGGPASWCPPPPPESFPHPTPATARTPANTATRQFIARCLPRCTPSGRMDGHAVPRAERCPSDGVFSVGRWDASVGGVCHGGTRLRTAGHIRLTHGWLEGESLRAS